MRTYIKSSKIVTPEGIISGVIGFENKKIVAIGNNVDVPANETVIDYGNDYVLPGFIEVHVHGGDGIDVMDENCNSVLAVSKAHCKHGTTSIFPTSVACSKERMFALFDEVRLARKAGKYANIMGVHMEGPYISTEMKGAQSKDFVRNPDINEAREICEYGKGVLARWSSAPELPLIKEFTEILHEYGIHPAIAHSNATCEDVIGAFDMGYNIITHLYSNTPSVRKINQRVHAGIIEAAYLLDDMYVELIGDGRHVPKELMQTVVKLKGKNRVMLVTDAMRAAGTNATTSFLGNKNDNNPVIIEDNVAKLPDRSFYAGSIATQERVFTNAVLNYGFSVEDVSAMLSQTPAEAMGLSEKGKLKVGFDADIVIADGKSLSIKDVFVGGNKQYFD